MKAKLLLLCTLLTIIFSCKTKCDCETDCNEPITKTEQIVFLIDSNNYISDSDLVNASISNSPENTDNLTENCSCLTEQEKKLLDNFKTPETVKKSLIEKCYKCLSDNIVMKESIRKVKAKNPCFWAECCPDFIAKLPSTQMRILSDDNKVLVDFDNLAHFKGINSDLTFFDIKDIIIPGIDTLSTDPVCLRNFNIEILPKGIKRPFKLRLNN